MEEKDLEKLAEKVAAKVSVKESAEVTKLKGDLVEAKSKIVEAEGKLGVSEKAYAESASKLECANKAVEDLRKQLPGGGLLKDPPKVMTVSEHIGVLEKLLPPPKVEQGTRKDWQKLCVFHYRGHKTSVPRKIFRLVRGGELCGVIVYSYPPPACYGRRLVLPRMTMQELNRQLSTINRVVVHPKYRTVGLG